MTLRSLYDINLAEQRLVVRADLNVPMENGIISDVTRITRFAQGMKPLLQKGISLVILSHFGRPKGKCDAAFSLRLIQDELSQAFGVTVTFADLDEAVKNMPKQGVLLVENLRFDPGEEENSPVFAARLAALGDIYVNDAFSCAHRSHASTEAITHLMPSVAGPLLLEEVSALGKALEAPKRPSVAIVGGSKVSTKIAVLKNLVTKVDHIIMGGGMANTFLFAQGMTMGKSIHETDQKETVSEIYSLAQKAGCTVHLPVDIVVAREFKAHTTMQIVATHDCPEDAMILDAGPASVAAFTKVLETARTILWNGPLGAFEIPPFERSTVALSKVVADLTCAGSVISVAGGGDTVSALNTAGQAEYFTYISAAGGAFLEWLEGKELPGIAALTP